MIIFGGFSVLRDFHGGSGSLVKDILSGFPVSLTA